MTQNLQFARTWQRLSDQELQHLLAQGKQLADSWGTPYGPVT
ncbi:MAG: hypothetical protein RIK87_09820 [Fuerstiella sp.]